MQLFVQTVLFPIEHILRNCFVLKRFEYQLLHLAFIPINRMISNQKPLHHKYNQSVLSRDQWRMKVHVRSMRIWVQVEVGWYKFLAIAIANLNKHEVYSMSTSTRALRKEYQVRIHTCTSADVYMTEVLVQLLERVQLYQHEMTFHRIVNNRIVNNRIVNNRIIQKGIAKYRSFENIFKTVIRYCFIYTVA